MITANGEALGIISRDEALQKAKEIGMDLVEISPKADPPVCKIIDYGKMLYALKKKEQKAKKAQKGRELKGIRLTFRIGPGDLDRQRKHAEKFLTTGHPVRVQMIMRGREKAHKDLAFKKMNDFIESLSDVSAIDQKPRFSGFQIVTILKPTHKAIK